MPAPTHRLFGAVRPAIQKGTRVRISLWDSLMFGRVPKTFFGQAALYKAYQDYHMLFAAHMLLVRPGKKCPALSR